MEIRLWLYFGVSILGWYGVFAFTRVYGGQEPADVDQFHTVAVFPGSLTDGKSLNPAWNEGPISLTRECGGFGLPLNP